MKANTLNIEELGMKKNESKELILSLLSQQIKHYKMQHLTEWEKNHSLSEQSINDKISNVKMKKEEVEAFFNECSASNEIDITISFDLKVKEEVLETAYA